MAYDKNALVARIDAVKLVRVEIKRNSVTMDEFKSSKARVNGRKIAPNLWPRITLECEGKVRTIPMKEGLGDPMGPGDPNMSSCRLSNEILKMAAGRRVYVSGQTWVALHKVSSAIRAKIMKKMRAASNSKAVQEKVRREVRAHERVAMIEHLTSTVRAAHGILEKKDVIRIWDSIHKELAVHSVMEA